MEGQKDKPGAMAEVVIRVQAGDDIWSEYLVAPVGETHAAVVELLKAYQKAKKKQDGTQPPSGGGSSVNVNKPGGLRQFFSPATVRGPSMSSRGGTGSNTPLSPSGTSSPGLVASPLVFRKGKEETGPKFFGVPLAEQMRRELELDPKVTCPRLVRECVQFLIRRGLWVEGIFRVSSAKADVDALRAGFESSPDLDLATSPLAKDPHAVSGVLKSYLRELPEPLLPENDYAAYLEASQMTDELSKKERFSLLLRTVPAINLRVLHSCLVLLSCVVRNAAVNKMTAGNCAVVLGPNILRKAADKSDAMAGMADAADVNRVAEWLISHHQVVPVPEESKHLVFATKFVAAAKSVFSLVRFDELVVSIDSSGTMIYWNSQGVESCSENLGIRPLGAVSCERNIWAFGQRGLTVRDQSAAQVFEDKTPIFGGACVGTSFWGATDKMILVYEGESFDLVQRIPLDCEFAFSLIHVPEANEVWAAGVDNTLVVFDDATYEKKNVIPNAHKKRVVQMATQSEQGTPMVYACSEDGSLSRWNVKKRERVAHVQAHDTKCNGVALTGSGTVVTCGWDTTVRVFSTVTLQPLQVFSGYHDDALFALLHVDGQIWAAGGDRCITAWNIPGQQQIQQRQAELMARTKRPSPPKKALPVPPQGKE